MRMVVLGDAMLDSDVEAAATRLLDGSGAAALHEQTRRERPGGAALAAALLAADGHELELVCAVGADREGEILRRRIERAGVRLVNIEAGGPTTCKSRVFADGRLVTRLDRGSPRIGRAQPAATRTVREADAVLVSDYGCGVASDMSLRAALAEAIDAGVPVVWDPHPNGSAPVAGVSLVTPNRAEAGALSEGAPIGGPAAAAQAAHRLREQWDAECVAVTLDADGAVVVSEDGALAVPAAPAVGDACGAGDRFAATALAKLATGSVEAAVSAAVDAASEFVASGAAGAYSEALEPAAIAPRNAVVATSGCFDLIHAGHLQLLLEASRLGRELVVLLNSDASVRRLKGPARPILNEHERAAILSAFEFVDRVEIFEQDTPCEALRRVRPQLFVKGGDYDARAIPEAAVMAELGGAVATVPLHGETSTTKLIERCRAPVNERNGAGSEPYQPGASPPANPILRGENHARSE